MLLDTVATGEKPRIFLEHSRVEYKSEPGPNMVSDNLDE